MTRCNVGKFLIVPTFVVRRLQVRKDARDPSGQSWNYLSRRLSCNFAEMTASMPFTDLFLARNLRQVSDTHNKVICYVACDKPHKKSNYSHP
jgi:hypothetical protein